MLNGFYVVASAQDVQIKLQDVLVYIALPCAAVVVLVAMFGGKIRTVGMILFGVLVAAGLAFASSSSIQSVGTTTWKLFAGLVS